MGGVCIVKEDNNHRRVHRYMFTKLKVGFGVKEIESGDGGV